MPEANKNRPYVSVVIPTYNQAVFLPLALASVLAQGWPQEKLEILVVDDGSTDDPGAVVTGYGLPCIQYLRQDNAGLSSARNLGLQTAHGDYLVFLDADDLLAPNYLRFQIATLEANLELDIATAANQYILALWPDAGFVPAGSWPLCAARQDVHLHYKNIAPCHAFTIRHSAMRHKRLFDVSFQACEDYDFWFGCLQDGLRFWSNPQALVLYRRQASSMSANAERQSHYDCLMVRRVFCALQQAAEDASTFASLAACLAGCLETMHRTEPYDQAQARSLGLDVLPTLLHRAQSLEEKAQPDALALHYRRLAGKIAKESRMTMLLGRGLSADLNRWAKSALSQPEPQGMFLTTASPLSLLELNRYVAALKRDNPVPSLRHDWLQAPARAAHLGLFAAQRLAARPGGLLEALRHG